MANGAGIDIEFGLTCYLRRGPDCRYSNNGDKCQQITDLKQIIPLHKSGVVACFLFVKAKERHEYNRSVK